MPEPRPRLVEFSVKDIGNNDQIAYTKIDFAKACQVGGNYAFSFYQLDYNAVANAAMGRSDLKLDDIKPIPVAKIVMNEDGLRQLLAEIKDLVEKISLKEQ